MEGYGRSRSQQGRRFSEYQQQGRSRIEDRRRSPSPINTSDLVDSSDSDDRAVVRRRGSEVAEGSNRRELLTQRLGGDFRPTDEQVYRVELLTLNLANKLRSSPEEAVGKLKEMGNTVKEDFEARAKPYTPEQFLDALGEAVKATEKQVGFFETVGDGVKGNARKRVFDATKEMVGSIPIVGKPLKLITDPAIDYGNKKTSGLSGTELALGATALALTTGVALHVANTSKADRDEEIVEGLRAVKDILDNKPANLKTSQAILDHVEQQLESRLDDREFITKQRDVKEGLDGLSTYKADLKDHGAQRTPRTGTFEKVTNLIAGEVKSSPSKAKGDIKVERNALGGNVLGALRKIGKLDARFISSAGAGHSQALRIEKMALQVGKKKEGLDDDLNDMHVELKKTQELKEDLEGREKKLPRKTLEGHIGNNYFKETLKNLNRENDGDNRPTAEELTENHLDRYMPRLIKIIAQDIDPALAEYHLPNGYAQYQRAQERQEAAIVADADQSESDSEVHQPPRTYTPEFNEMRAQFQGMQTQLNTLIARQAPVEGQPHSPRAKDSNESFHSFVVMNETTGTATRHGGAASRHDIQALSGVYGQEETNRVKQEMGYDANSSVRGYMGTKMDAGVGYGSRLTATLNQRFAGGTMPATRTLVIPGQENEDSQRIATAESVTDRGGSVASEDTVRQQPTQSSSSNPLIQPAQHGRSRRNKRGTVEGQQ